MLTPVAIAAGRRLADRLFGGELEARLDYDDIPSVVFSHPPVGSVGLTEPEARQRFGADSIKSYARRFTNIYHAVTEHRSTTFVKLVVAGAEERVVGIHVSGPRRRRVDSRFCGGVAHGRDQERFRSHGRDSPDRGRRAGYLALKRAAESIRRLDFRAHFFLNFIQRAH